MGPARNKQAQIYPDTLYRASYGAEHSRHSSARSERVQLILSFLYDAVARFRHLRPGPGKFDEWL